MGSSDIVITMCVASVVILLSAQIIAEAINGLNKTLKKNSKRNEDDE